ncbi:MAG: saccharopine dehydrogenase C-terminal domain-containing protein [Thermodesulfobacteriota bacterium]|nr:saccharopine dehydrogenase C-terminal domain-containing protein [Thermodesulfobacteriota bacterium]
MKAIVLGMGLQGKAVIHDLESSSMITEIFAADLFTTEKSLTEADDYLAARRYTKTKAVKLDVSMEKGLAEKFSERDIDVVICMLPIQLALTAARAALDAGIPFVSSNYTYDLSVLDDPAKEKNGIILPEMGLDPGIDLILGRLAMDELDVVYGINSYGGGIPAPECADDSPIKYKISWIFDRVLDVYVREARFIKNGQLHTVPGNEIFRQENVHEIEFPGIGTVEAYFNGDSERYVKIFGLGNELLEMGRYALRWPGHSKFWRTMVELGLLDDTPININKTNISPRSFLAKCITPKLQYKSDEKDVALLRVEAWGLKDTKKVKVTYDLIDYRDLETGLFAMNRTVGFTASIGALMILSGKITETGVLSPVRHVPSHEFLDEVKARGMHVDYTFEEMDESVDL